MLDSLFVSLQPPPLKKPLPLLYLLSVSLLLISLNPGDLTTVGGVGKEVDLRHTMAMHVICVQTWDGSGSLELQVCDVFISHLIV